MGFFNRRRGGIWGCAGCIGSVMLVMGIFACVGAILFGVFSTMRQSEPFVMAMSEINGNETAVSILGEPIEAGWLVSGSFETSGPTGEAEFAIPVSGPQGEGKLFVVALKSAGVWEITNLVLEANGERVPLLLGR